MTKLRQQDCLITKQNSLIRRRRVHGKTFYDKAIANPAYSDTADNNNIAIVSPTLRSSNLDIGPADAVTGFTTESQFEDQYNIIENIIDDEYNKISFKENIVPFDENYGHVNPTDCAEGNEYNHIERIPGQKLNNYSCLKQRLNLDTNSDKSPCKPEIQHDSSKSEEEWSYDPLSFSAENQREKIDNKVTDYSHLTSNKHAHAGTEGIHGGKGSRENVTETLADKVKDKDGNNDADHSYFVLESDPGNKKVKTNCEIEDDAHHQYFVLEPNTEIHNDIKEVKMKGKDADGTQHQYCDLQPRIGIDGMKTKAWATDGTQHQYCALEHNNDINKTKSECHGEDDEQHQYFVLEPEADIQKGEDYI